MDTTPIVARLSAIADSVNALKELRTLTYEQFVAEHIVYAAAERDFQVAIQAALDIGTLILAHHVVHVPENYRDVFPALATLGVLPPNFARRITPMAQFRNVLVHLYLQVDARKVYDYLQHNLGDLELFAQYIGEYLAADTSGPAQP